MVLEKAHLKDRTKTDTGGFVFNYTTVYERTMLKELGKMAP